MNLKIIFYKDIYLLNNSSGYVDFINNSKIIKSARVIINGINVGVIRVM